MKRKELKKAGIAGAAMAAAMRAAQEAEAAGIRKKDVLRTLKAVAKNPAAHVDDAYYGPAAQVLLAQEGRHTPPSEAMANTAPYKQWGEDLDPKSITQMNNACKLPVAVRGALMPDAHVGYGLPIGGVLATDNAVIPYAVGVDIACRMKMTVLDIPPAALDGDVDRLKRAIEEETKFGVGASFKQRRQHAVMDCDWNVSPVTAALKDKAWAQLGTSGSGNHFVEFGIVEIIERGLGPGPGAYLALLSHSGSRGTGAQVCNHYSKLAQERTGRSLPPECRHLAWLDLDSPEGHAYWAAMNLMGEYAAANHALIHYHVAKNLGAEVLLDIENHHNFAWEEEHDGKKVIVHRKGATPAGAGVLGIIPGSMASPAYVVRGKGNEDALASCSHGAGRVMSRSQAKKTLSWAAARRLFAERGVTVLSAGLDEVPMVYKDIDTVMAAQADLVAVVAKFQPRLVKMAPGTERPED